MATGPAKARPEPVEGHAPHHASSRTPSDMPREAGQRVFAVVSVRTQGSGGFGYDARASRPAGMTREGAGVGLLCGGKTHSRGRTIDMPSEDTRGRGVSRRQLLRVAVLGSGSATLAAILAACGETQVVTKEVPVEIETIKEVPVDRVVVQEVPVEVEVEKLVEVEKVVEVEVEVEVERVATREVERLVDVRRGGTLIVRHTRDPQVGGIEGAQALAEVDKSIAFMISETLLTFAFEKVEPVPWLAESFEISPDGKFIDLTIRKGIKFHDGTDFDADAAVFNLNRVFMDDHPFHDTGVYPYTNWALLSHAEKLSDDVVRVFSGLDADPILAWRLTTEATYMTSPAAIEQFGEDIDLNPVGTGPFKFDSFEPGVQLSLVRNEDYWNPDNAPFLDKVIYRIIPDAQAAVAEFRAGNLDVFPFALTPDILELRDDARFRLQLFATNTYFYLSSNNAIDPFDNRDFRKARPMPMTGRPGSRSLSRSTSIFRRRGTPTGMGSIRTCLRTSTTRRNPGRSWMTLAGSWVPMGCACARVTASAPASPSPPGSRRARQWTTTDSSCSRT